MGVIHKFICNQSIFDNIIIEGTVSKTVATDAQNEIFTTVCISLFLADFKAVNNSGEAEIIATIIAHNHKGKP
jgi:hypothetical protein